MFIQGNHAHKSVSSLMFLFNYILIVLQPLQTPNGQLFNDVSKFNIKTFSIYLCDIVPAFTNRSIPKYAAWIFFTLIQSQIPTPPSTNRMWRIFTGTRSSSWFCARLVRLVSSPCCRRALCPDAVPSTIVRAAAELRGTATLRSAEAGISSSRRRQSCRPPWRATLTVSWARRLSC